MNALSVSPEEFIKYYFQRILPSIKGSIKYGVGGGGYGKYEETTIKHCISPREIIGVVFTPPSSKKLRELRKLKCEELKESLKNIT